MKFTDNFNLTEQEKRILIYYKTLHGYIDPKMADMKKWNMTKKNLV